MLSVAEAAEPWDLVALVVLLLAFYFAYKLFLTFRGGKLSNAHLYALLAAVVLLATFVLSFSFDVLDIVPVTAYGISVKNIGILAAAVLMILAGRDMARFWVRRTSLGT